jgi:hypothetical protein
MFILNIHILYSCLHQYINIFPYMSLRNTNSPTMAQTPLHCACSFCPSFSASKQHAGCCLSCTSNITITLAASLRVRVDQAHAEVVLRSLWAVPVMGRHAGGVLLALTVVLLLAAASGGVRPDPGKQSSAVRAHLHLPA